MSDIAKISVSGRLLILELEPDNGSWTQDVTEATASENAITLAASGGTVNVIETIISEKYPFANLSSNRVKVIVTLSRQIAFGETVTVSYGTGYVSESGRTNNSATNLSVTNNSYWHDDVGELITDTTKILYVDPTLGNDTNAAAVNSSDGYYVRTDSEVGNSPTSPDGSIVAYATLGAAADVLSSSDTALILLKRGETFDGSTQFMSAGSMLGGSFAGQSSTEPLIFAAYGSGSSDAVFSPSNNGTTGNRSINISGTRANYVVGRGISATFGSGNDVIRFLAPGSDGDYGHILFVGMKTEFINPRASTAGSGNRIRSDIAFVNCLIDNGGAASGLEGSDDFDDFTYRQFEFYQCVFSNLGDNTGLEHSLYTKSIGDLVVQECFFYNSGGAGLKLDNCWGVEASRNIFTEGQTLCNIESNGDPSAGTPLNRNEDTETGEYPNIGNAAGAYSKWVTVKDNVISDFRSIAVSASLVNRMGQAYDSIATNNLMVSNRAVISTACSFVSNGGSDDGGYTRDSYRCKFNNNTISLISTSDSTQKYGVTITSPTTDTFNTTNNNSKGHHEIEVNNNVFIFRSASDQTGTVHSIRIREDSWGDAETAGRLDGEINNNIAYRVGGGQSAFYADDSTTYSTFSSWETDINTNGTSASGNSFGNPSMPDFTYQVSDYAIDAGFSSLADMVASIQSDYLSGSIRTSLQTETIAEAMIENHIATQSGRGVALWSSMISDTPSSGGSTIASVRRLNIRAAPRAIASPKLSISGTRPALLIRNDSTTEESVTNIDVRPGEKVVFDDVATGYEIRYTTNGKVPTYKSKLYNGPIALNRNLTGSDNTVIKARIYNSSNPNIYSRTTKISVRVV